MGLGKNVLAKCVDKLLHSSYVYLDAELLGDVLYSVFKDDILCGVSFLVTTEALSKLSCSVDLC